MKKMLVNIVCSALLLASVPPQAMAAAGAQYNSVRAEFAALNQAPGCAGLLKQSAGDAVRSAAPLGAAEQAGLRAVENVMPGLLRQKAAGCGSAPNNGWGSNYPSYASWCRSCGGTPYNNNGVGCSGVSGDSTYSGYSGGGGGTINPYFLIGLLGGLIFFGLIALSTPSGQ